MDRLTPSRRSWNMGCIRSQNTRPERRVRSLLHRRGYRFSLHRKDLPGKPDVVLSRFRAVVFVHGCFWHRHKGCVNATIPKTRTDFWIDKFFKNVQRDRTNASALKKLGWRVLVVWECELKDETVLQDRLSQWLSADENT